MRVPESPEIRATSLPGFGERYEFTASSGEQVGVVRHHDGDREVIVFSQEDPDACRLSLRLSGEDARALGRLLGEGQPDTGV